MSAVLFQNVSAPHTCKVCGTTKPPTDFKPQPWTRLGHSEECLGCRDVRKEAEAARAEEKRLAKCPTPDKRVHRTADEAKAHIRSLYRNGRGNTDYQAYRCACGVWHVGHSSVHLQQRIQKALRGRKRARR